MIASLFGAIVERHGQDVVIQCSNVGYEVRFVGEVPCFPTKPEHYFIHSHHTETEGTKLYGFTEPGIRAMFRTLIAIPGVGPGKACAVLDVMNAEDLFEEVLGRVEMLSSIPGIGPKTRRAIVEALL